MMKIKMPEYYRAPLKSKRDIIDWITSNFNRPYYDRNDGSWFHWDVSVPYKTDLSFDRLLEILDWGYIGDSDFVPKEQIIAALRQRYEDNGPDEYTLWDCAVDNARESVRDDDGYKMLWDGTDVGAEWWFLGRNGKHLCLAKFDGCDISRRIGDQDLVEYLEDLHTDGKLHTLYKFLVQCNHDFKPEYVQETVEYAAAFDLFVNFLNAEEVVKELEAEAQLHMEGAGI